MFEAGSSDKQTTQRVSKEGVERASVMSAIVEKKISMRRRSGGNEWVPNESIFVAG